MASPTRPIQILLCALLLAVVPAAQALADPTQVELRIEGLTQTLFEGPLLTDGHPVRAASDSQERGCDATNNGQNPEPGATPTAAADDAMRLLGLDFDGQWYPGFDDYFIQRIGPDREQAGKYRYWGLMVNGNYTSLGGCQQLLDTDDRATWVYDAFTDRRLLSLTAADSSTGSPDPGSPTLQVEPGQPFELQVSSYTGGMDGSDQDQRRQPGITVAPVITAENGFQQIDLEHSGAQETGSDGAVTLTLSEPGWHRFKASEECSYVRSNRVDICVGDCPEPPWDVAPRSAPAFTDPSAGQITAAARTQTTGADGDPCPGTDPGPGPGPGGEKPPQPPPPPAPAPDPPDRGRLGSPAIAGPILVDGLRRRGLVGVRWRLTDPGVGIRRWRIDSRQTGPGANWVPRAAGPEARSQARLRLPAGREHQLRFLVADRSGRTAVANLGRVLVPIDDRARALRYRGAWRDRRSATAWRGTLRLGGTGSRLSFRLPPGRPALVLGPVRRPVVIAVNSAGRTARYRVTPSRRARIRTVLGPRRARAAPVTVRVLRGALPLDGVAVVP